MNIGQTSVGGLELYTGIPLDVIIRYKNKLEGSISLAAKWAPRIKTNRKHYVFGKRIAHRLYSNA